MSQQSYVYEYAFDRKNLSQFSMFSFLAAPQIYTYEIKGAKFFRKIVSFAKIPSRFTKLSDSVVPQLEKSLTAKYGPLPYKNEDNAIMWYPDMYFLGRSLGTVVHMSPQMYEKEDYYPGAETLAHELAHLPFGYQLWTDLEPSACDKWLMEGWTSFEAMLFMKEFEGEAFYQDLVRRNAGRISERKDSVCSDPYAAGALMHVYLSQVVGLNNYFKATKEFLSLKETRKISTEEWIRFLSKANPEKLELAQIQKILKMKGSKFWQNNLVELRD